ncbi:MAG: hypothetical protein ACK5HR_04500 [Mycoplasmatales bacterium]
MRNKYSWEEEEIKEFIEQNGVGFNFGIEINLSNNNMEEEAFMVISDGELGEELFFGLMEESGDLMDNDYYYELIDIIEDVKWNYESQEEIEELLKDKGNLIINIGWTKKL